MPRINFHDRVTLLNLIKLCGKEKKLWKVRRIHVDLLKRNLIRKDVYIATSLITTYAKCGAPEEAREVFEQLGEPSVVSWNALISGYAHSQLGDEALKCFKYMQNVGVIPDVVTYICVLKACGIIGSYEIAHEIEVEVRKKELVHKHVKLGNALVDMYFKCGALEKAREVFDHLTVRDVVSWNVLITGYAQHGLGDEALKCFRQMKDAKIFPDVVTYVCILKACGTVGSLEVGQDIDVEVRKRGLLQKDVMLGTSLVDMYCKCGALEKAQEVFAHLPMWNVVTWSVLINGYVQHGLDHEALKCFRKMEEVGTSPDEITYICILKACGSVGSLEIGEEIDAKVRKQGLLQKDIVLGTALVDMYSKCGALKKAGEVFEYLPVQNVVSWSALISGYAQLGQTNVVWNLYRRMRREGVVPNFVTFTVMLNACSHAGLVKDGEKLFNEMCVVYDLTPSLEHYTCMIDLFGRAGHFDKAKALLEKVSHSGHLPLFLNILGACKKWRNMKLARWLFEKLIELDENCAAAYVYMENIYAAAGMQME